MLHLLLPNVRFLFVRHPKGDYLRYTVIYLGAKAP